MIILLLVTLVIVNHCLWAQTSQPVHLYEQAKALYDGYNYSGCIELIESQHKTVDNLQTSVLLGMAYHKYRDFSRSILTLKSALSSEKLIKQTPEEYFQGYLFLAQNYRFLSQRDSLQLYLNKAEKLLDEVDDNMVHSGYLIEKGLSLVSEDRDKADLYFIRGLETIGNKDHNIIKLHVMIADHLESVKPDSGMYYLTKAKELHAKYFSQDTLSLIELYLQEGYQLYRLGKIKKSTAIFEEVLRPMIFGNHVNNNRRYEFESSSFYRLALITHNYSGKYKTCIDYGKKYLEIAPKFYSLDHFRFGEVYRDLANTYYKLGRNATYSEYLQKATTILDQNDFYHNSNLVYKAKGSLVAKDYTTSLAYCDSLLTIEASQNEFTWKSRETGYYKLICLSSLDRLKELSEFTNWITTKLVTELNYDFNKTLKYKFFAFAALEQERKALNQSGLFGRSDSLRISMVRLKLDSLYSVTISPLLAGEERKPLVAVSLLNFYGYDQMIKNNWDSAAFFFDKAIQYNTNPPLEIGKIPNIQGVRRSNEMVESLWLKALNNKEKYTETNDIVFLKRTLEFLILCDVFNEDINKKQGSFEDKINQISGYFDDGINEELMNTIYELWQLEKNNKYLDQAMLQMEKRKSYVLLESLKKKEAQHAAVLPDSILLREASLSEQISYLENKIKGYDKDSRSNLLSQFRHNLTLAKQEQDQLQGYLEKQYPQYYKIKYDLDLITMADTRSNLGEKEVLLHYYTGEEYNFVLAISTEKSLLVRLDTLNTETIQQFRESLLPERSFKEVYQVYQDYSQSAYQLYLSQLSPVQEILEDIDKIYIIPDGLLHYIPFEALIASLPKEGENNFKTLDYLINRYTFSYGYSASTLFKSRSLLSIFENRKNKVLAFAPKYDNNAPQPYGSVRGELKDLKWNNDEIKGIAQYFDGDYLNAEEATEAYFGNMASRYDILHFSMHAIVNHSEPMYSHLSFTKGSDEDSLYDGYLHAFELYNMSLDAQLVVLSACNTGYGKLHVGEGVMSLAKAFAYAGCRSVVMSHWPAEDKSSSEIMKLFYQYLADGMHKDEALRQAKLKYLETAPLTNQSPAFWNNFVITGDVSPLVKNRTNLYVVIGLFAFVLLLGISYLIRGRLRQKVN